MIYYLEQLGQAADNFDLDGLDRAYARLESTWLPSGLQTSMAVLGAYVADVNTHKVKELSTAMIAEVYGLCQNCAL
jgi:hypothetical protein